MSDRQEVFLDVDVRHTGLNAELWARKHSIYNPSKYNRLVKPVVEQFIKDARKERLDLSIIEGKVELVGVEVYGPEEAVATHRYYFHQEKISLIPFRNKKKK